MSISWSIDFVNDEAKKEVLELSADLKASFAHISEILITFGPHNVGMPHVRPLVDKMWEIRMKGKDNIARSIYFLSSKQTIIILHTFIKKTPKAPARVIKIAKKRLKTFKGGQ